MTHPSTTTLKQPAPCKCCHGTGTQLNTMTGLQVLCPCCGGSGNMPQTDPTYEVVS